MTGRELAAVQELRTTPDALAAKTAKWDAQIAADRADKLAREGGRPMTLGEIVGAEGTPAKDLDAPKPRRTSVKGVCVNCGKNWSRHTIGADDDGKEVSWCTAGGDNTERFSLERKPAPAPAPEQGKLSSTQASRLLDLIASAESRRVEWDAAQAHASKAQERMHDADAELLAFIRENTQS